MQGLLLLGRDIKPPTRTTTPTETPIGGETQILTIRAVGTFSRRGKAQFRGHRIR